MCVWIIIITLNLKVNIGSKKITQYTFNNIKYWCFGIIFLNYIYLCFNQTSWAMNVIRPELFWCPKTMFKFPKKIYHISCYYILYKLWKCRSRVYFLSDHTKHFQVYWVNEFLTINKIYHRRKKRRTLITLKFVKFEHWAAEHWQIWQLSFLI